MVENRLVVAALLLTAIMGSAAAADIPEHSSPNAQKLLATLNAAGINDKEVQDFISEMNAHVDGGYFNFAEENIAGGKLALRYPLSTANGPRRLELNYAPEDSRVAVTARTDGVIVSYQLRF